MSLDNTASGAAKGAPPESVALPQLVNYTLQLALILLVGYLYRIEEGAGFLRIAPVIFIGFLVHTVLPLRFRMQFFLVLSLYCIVALLGAKHGTGLIVLGLGLIGICHLPLPYMARVATLLVVAVLLWLVRGGLLTTGWEYLRSPVLPLLSIMFMFRIAVYIYDIEHMKKRVPWSHRLAYFFLLPSTCFPLFPVLDFQAFGRYYYDRPAAEIYQKGLRWMLRGMVHLLMYRFVYHYITPVPDEVQSLGGTVQFAVSSYLLYLRVSGLFHLIIGILCLFGLNFPETHRLYYLASSFTDFWRRINIYWKDFMMKMLYYPLVMRLRSKGMGFAIVVCTMATLVISWILHSYQVYWLKGEFHITLQDGLFWTILGVLVSINALLEFKGGKRASLSKKKWSSRDAFILSLKTLSTFTAMTILWSFWTSDSIPQWWAVMRAAGNSGIGAYGVLILCWLGLLVGGIALQYVDQHSNVFKSLFEYTGRGPAVATFAVAALLIVAVQPQIYAVFGPRSEDLFALIGSEQMNQRDRERMTRGYYEDLLDNQDMTSATWKIGNTMPKDWVAIADSEFAVERDDLLVYELKPSASGTHHRVTFQTNRWGMCDQEYDKEKPEGVYRIAMVGASCVMGSGVDFGGAFEAQLEETLNKLNPKSSFQQIEVLNFGVGGMALPQSVAIIENKVMEFSPDLLIYVEDSGQGRRAFIRITEAIRDGKSLVYPYLESLVEKADVDSSLAGPEIEHRLSPYRDEVVDWAYTEMARICSERNVPLVWAGLEVPAMSRRDLDEMLDPLEELARAKGFLTLDMEDSYRGADPEAIIVAAWDNHPNQLGHELIAQKMLEEMQSKGLLAPLGIETIGAE